MAEVFQKPPLFSKKWWSYFWDYYKWYVIAVVAIIAVIWLTVVQVANQPKYIFNVTYAGSGYFSQEMVDNLKEKITPQINEENDGILFTQLNFNTSQNADIQYESALYQKMELQLITDETMLFLFDEENLKTYTETNSMGDIWTPSEKWAENISDDLKMGEYGVCLKDSRILKEMGINGENLYIAIRNNYKPDNEDAQKRYNYSITAGKMLIE